MVLVLKNGATKQQMQSLTKKIKKANGVDTRKYCGVIKLKHDPLEIQKQMRNEWG